MKIKVDRKHSDIGDLVFTITVSEPHHSFFGLEESRVMELLDECKVDINKSTSEQNKTRDKVLDFLHAAKEETFVRVLDNLKFAIENEFRPKFKSICQEIYNWIYDYQIDNLKKWMIEFDPQRTKYYFDNDPKANLVQEPQESEHEGEEDDFDDDEEEDEDEGEE